MPSWNPEANELFLKALDRPSGEERRWFLDEACRDRPDLRAQVEGLLAASEKAGSFLEASPVDLSVTGEPHPSVPEEEIDPLGQNIPGGTSPPLSEGPGTRIGPYKLLEQIGEGGMGVVYMAEQVAPVRRRVALKIIKPGMDSQQVIARFEAERQALALMEHQNIARVFDAGATETGRPFFVMELVHGVPITAYCDLNRLTLGERLELFVPVCQAVQHAHQKGIIHRDIKPSNVLVTLYDGRPVPKVIDFGIAKAIEQRLTERTLFTRYGMIVGTLQYMSPEQAEMSGLGVDTRSDIYALGVLLYELLTGSTPLEPSRLQEAAYAELLQMIREVEPAKPSTRISTSEEGLASISAQRRTDPTRLAKLLEGELDWIVMKALEKDRTRRYESAVGLAHDLEHYLADEPVEACPPSAGYRLRKIARKHRTGLMILAAFVGLLIMGLVACAFLMVRAMAAERHAKDEALKAGQERDRAIHAEQHAEAESALVMAMNNFLQHELLEQADPTVHGSLEQKPDKDIKLRTVLDRAARRVAGAFPDSPELEAAIRRSIGEAYRGLGEFDLARPHLEAAYEWDRRNLGDDDNATLLAQNGLAILYLSTGEYAKAESLLVQALESRKRTLGPEHPETLTVQTNLGTVYLSLQQFAKAEAQLLPALETRRRISGPDHPDTLIPEKFLAEVYRLWGQYGRAEPLMVHALEMHRRGLGPKHPSTLAFQAELAELYRAKSDYGKAEPLLLQAAEGFRETLGADHSSTLTTETNLAGLYVAIGEHARAEKLYVQCIDAYQRKLGSDHPGTAAARQNLATLYTTQKKFDKAEPLLVQALEVFRRKYDPDSPSTLNCESNLAIVYRNLGQVARAEALYLKILEKRREKLGPDHPHTLVTQNNLAVLYRERGEYEKAEPLLMQTLEARRKKLGDDHPYTLNSQFNLALLYKEQGAQPKAEELLTQNLEARRRKLGAEHPDTLISLSSLADLYQARGEYAKAEPLYEQLVEIQRRKLSAGDPQLAATLAQLGFNLLRQQKHVAAETPLRESLQIRAEKLPDSWMRFNTESMLGGSLLGQKKYAEAEPLLLAGYTEMKDRADKIPAQGKVHLTHAVERIVDLYTAWGKKDEAEEWRKKSK